MFPGGPSGVYGGAVIVQQAQSSVFGQSNDATTPRTTFAHPVTAGNLLVAIASRRGSSLVNTGTTNGGSGSARPFTFFAPGVRFAEGIDNPELAAMYRVATGDEQDMTWGGAGTTVTKTQITIYELAGAGDPTTFEVLSATYQSASAVKSLGPFSQVSSLQLAGVMWDNTLLDHVPATGYTQDFQSHDATTGDWPGTITMHGSAGSAPGASGESVLWGGMAVGIKHA